MSNTLSGTASSRKYLPVIIILSFGIPANAACADWSSQNSYNPGYGEFPPDNIDQHIQNSLEKYSSPSVKSPAVKSTSEISNKPVQPSPSQNYPSTSFGNHDQTGAYRSPQDNYSNNTRKKVNGPRSNNSGFSGPWNNGSGFTGPWNTNGSGFSMPWGSNNDSGMNMPWNNHNGNNHNRSNHNWSNNNWSNNKRGHSNNRRNDNGASFSMPRSNR